MVTYRPWARASRALARRGSVVLLLVLCTALRAQAIGPLTMIQDINPAGGSDPAELTGVGGTIYFSAYDDEHGYELWRSDGSPEGTVLVKDILSGPQSGQPVELESFQGALFFNAYGRDLLYRSDGTAAGTIPVRDRNGDTITGAVGMEVIRGLMFFVAGPELWRTDGTRNGTFALRTLPVGAFGSVGRIAFFSAYDDAHGFELWRSDGTRTGTYRVRDIHPDGDSSPSGFVNVGGTLFFSAHEPTHGRELWKSDGTKPGTRLVKDIDPRIFEPDPGTSYPADANPEHLVGLNGILYFSASDAQRGGELWRSDGTRLGTRLVKNINASGDGTPSAITRFGSNLLFSATDGGGFEPWVSDGTGAGTSMLKDLNPDGESSPAGFARVGTEVVFGAYDPVAGYEPWATDGTEAGTQRIADIWPGSGGSYPVDFTVAQGFVLFSANDGSGYEPWGGPLIGTG